MDFLKHGKSMALVRSSLYPAKQVFPLKARWCTKEIFALKLGLTFENLHTALKEAGASLEDIVKLGVYLMDMGNLPDYGAVQAEFFRGSMPAQTVAQINSLAFPGMMIEVEAVAVR